MSSASKILKQRLTSSPNPEWWLSVFGVAYAYGGNAAKAAEMADQYVSENPYPPEDELNEATQVINEMEAAPTKSLQTKAVGDVRGGTYGEPNKVARVTQPKGSKKGGKKGRKPKQKIRRKGLEPPSVPNTSPFTERMEYYRQQSEAGSFLPRTGFKDDEELEQAPEVVHPDPALPEEQEIPQPNALQSPQDAPGPIQNTEDVQEVDLAQETDSGIPVQEEGLQETQEPEPPTTDYSQFPEEPVGNYLQGYEKNVFERDFPNLIPVLAEHRKVYANHPGNAAIKEYTNKQYAITNNALRKVKNPEKLSPVDEERVAFMDDLIANSPFPADVTLWRRMSPKELRGSPRVGMYVSDPAYLSTSLRKEGTDTFDEKVLMKIKTKKGQTGFVVNTDDPTTPSEFEVLLPRRTRYRITKVTQQNGWYNVEAEVV